MFVLDEVDRLDEAGGAVAALLEAVDPMPGAAFRDRYLDLPFDLSEALFVATATNLGSVPAMLRERMQIVELPGYAEAEKREIVARYLLPGLLRLHGLTADQVEVTDEAVGAVIGPTPAATASIRISIGTRTSTCTWTGGRARGRRAG